MTATRTTVPLLDLKAQYATLRSEIEEVVAEVFESQWFIGGPHVAGLEEELAAYVGARHGVGVTSGTDALLLSLWALGVGPGDEVVTTPYSFFSTLGSIVRLGARPVLVDIDPLTCNLDVSRLAAALTERTRAILPVHLFGQCADMRPLRALADERGLPVVEDACQSVGATDADGGRAGSLGTAACFSFFPSKNLGGAGDGGMISTNDEALAQRLRVMRNHGMEPKYQHALMGGNFRLDALQAAVLRVKLRHLEGWARARRANAADYRALLEERGLDNAVTPLFERPGVTHVYNQFVVRVPADRRDELVEHLRSVGIGCEIYYPVPCHLQPCFGDLGWRPGDFPEAERAAAQTLALPIYAELEPEQKRAVVDAMAEVLTS